MEIKRRPLQGLINIIRFNWHFYLWILCILLVLSLLKSQLPETLQSITSACILAGEGMLLISLLTSLYIYDLSDLYQIKWIENINNKSVLNIHAGFDETSNLIINKFPQAKLSICDFYDAKKHTEISIQRARKIYTPHPTTISVQTHDLPFPANYFDQSFTILSAHEIRNPEERIQFFIELRRITRGKIFVTEHLRDFKNFLGFSIGAFHFHSRKTWIRTFRASDLAVKREMKTTPFITTFELEKNGNSY